MWRRIDLSSRGFGRSNVKVWFSWIFFRIDWRRNFIWRLESIFKHYSVFGAADCALPDPPSSFLNSGGIFPNSQSDPPLSVPDSRGNETPPSFSIQCQLERVEITLLFLEEKINLSDKEIGLLKDRIQVLKVQTPISFPELLSSFPTLQH